MSEVIVRMKMPKDCYDCPMYDFASYRGKLTLCCNAHLDLKPIPNNGNPRPSWCPIIGVLPEQHGDLIDRDQFKENLDMVCYAGGWLNTITQAVRDYCKKQVDAEKTIVPATERSET